MKPVAMTMRAELLLALNRVLDALDSGRDHNVIRRSAEYLEARAQLKRAEIRARNGKEAV